MQQFLQETYIKYMLVPIERAESNMLLKAAVKYHCADLLGLFYPDFPWDVLPLPVSPFFPHVRSRTFISLHVWWCSTCFEQKLWWRLRRWRKTVINLTQNIYSSKMMTKQQCSFVFPRNSYNFRISMLIIIGKSFVFFLPAFAFKLCSSSRFSSSHNNIFACKSYRQCG